MLNKKSLYRIYRPKNFDELAGQFNIKEILTNQIRNNNFPNSLLFTGLKGSGKTSLAKIFAKAINCENINDYNPCNTCNACISINNDSNFDILELDAASNNGIDEIRNIKNKTTTLPTSLKYKVYIIDEVHMLSNQAFNALLKILEEPPTHVVFILATTELNKIPDTIISRCQTHDFKSIDLKSMKSRIEKISTSEGFEIDDEAIKEIYHLSEGSLRDALNYLEQCVVFSGNKVSVENLKKLFYISTKIEKIELIKNILNHNVSNIISFFEKAKDNGLNFSKLIIGLIDIIKECIEFTLTNDRSVMKSLTKEDFENINKYNINELFKIADILEKSYKDLNNINLGYDLILLNILSLVTKKEEQLISVIEREIPKTEKLNIDRSKEINNEFEKVEIKLEEKENTLDDQNLNNLEKIKLEKIVNLSQKLNSEINIIDDQIFNVIVKAKKESRDFYSEKIESIFLVDSDNNLLNYEFAIDFILFMNSKITAANDEAAVVVVENKVVARILNNQMQQVEFRNKLFKFIDYEAAFLIIDANRWNSIKVRFKNNLNEIKNKTYESIADTNYFYENLLVKDSTVDEEKSDLKKAKDFFGYDNVKVIK